MRLYRRFLFGLIIAVLASFCQYSSVSAYYSNMPASVVIGQTNFTDHVTGVSSTNFANGQLRGLFVDPNGRLIFSDTNNNRVLIWNSVPTTNGVPADVVLGQPDFISNDANNGGRTARALTSPGGVYSDGQRLIVEDGGNKRVLIWNTFPTYNQEEADIVVGQNSMSVADSVCDSSHLGSGQAGAVWVYNNRLVVSSNDQRRVLIWNSVPTTNGVPADVVLGQPNMTTCVVTNSPTQTSLNSPRGLMVDRDGRVFVVDGTNANRILMWNSIPTSDATPADVVIGQADFTSKLTSVNGATLNIPLGVYSTGNRLYVADNNNNRVLVWNSIPTSNGTNADLVLGQADFVQNTNYGTTVSTFQNPQAIFEYQSKLLVSEGGGDRILIFPNILSTPQLSLKSIEAIEYGKRRITGSVHLGEVGKYTLHNVRVSVNGEGSSFVTHLDGGTVYDNNTVYEWFHEFTPPGSGEYTLKITSSSINAEDTSLFYFTPFNLNSVTGGIITFSVPKDQVNTVKNEVDHFEVWNKVTSSEDFTRVDGDIPTSVLNEHGVASVSIPTSGEVKVVAVSKTSGWRQDSNTLQSAFSGTYINPNNYSIYNFWYPLQINSISGVTKNILSSFTPSGIQANYYSNTFTPTFTGISFNGSTVAMRVTNTAKTQEYKDYLVEVTGSVWKLTPKLYPKSIINLSVYDTAGRYNQILPLTISISSSTP